MSIILSAIRFSCRRSEPVMDFVPQMCPPFYEHLRQVTENRNITRYELKKTRIKSSHMVDWNRGSDSHILSLIELADYLEVTLDYFIGREK